MRLTKQKIMEASIAILNREGADGLTMRTLAAELNVKASSIYWHVKGKRGLYGELAEFISAQVEITASMEQPKKYVYELCSKYRTRLLATRDAAELFLYSQPETPRRSEIMEGLCECLKNTGVKEENCHTAANLLRNYVLTFAAEEGRFKNEPPVDTEGESPSVSRQKSLFYYEAQFLYGLEVIFAGLKSVSPSRQGAGSRV